MSAFGALRLRKIGMQETNQNDRGIAVEDTDVADGKGEKAVKREAEGMQTSTEQLQEQGQDSAQSTDTHQETPSDAKNEQHGEHDTALDELTALRARLEEKGAEAKANYDLFLRERAELENFKRRMQREKSEALKFANEPLIRDLLSIIDNLERATAHAQGGGDGQSLVEGVSLVLRSFSDVLEKYGVVRIAAKGEPFDPSKHEAMAQVETTEFAPNRVVEEHVAGYSLHDRLLRAAMVSIAKAPPAADAAPGAQDGHEASEKKSGD